MDSKSQNDLYLESNVQLSPDSPRSIRVLDLLPGTRKAPIRANLRVVSLDAYPRPYYEALSYTWRPDKPTVFVTINEIHQLEITANAFAALESLRLRRETRTIWIDSICINQESKTEKAIQVPLMGDVYRHAAIVNVWLGRTSVNSDSGINFRRLFDFRLWAKAWRAVRSDAILKPTGPQDLVNTSETKRLARNQAIYNVRSDLNLLWHALHGRDLALIGAIQDNSPWHERLWIVQEYLLARRIQFGFGFHWIECEIAIPLNWTRAETEAVTSFKTTVGLDFAAIRLNLDPPSAPNSLSLGDLQNILRTQKCLKKQDMVYGMLGLIDPYQAALISVNYELDPYKVFAQATYAVMRSETTFRVLDMVDLMARRHDSSHPNDGDEIWEERHGDTSKLLPSWAIDFANFPKRGHWQQGSWRDVDLARRRQKFERCCRLSDDFSKLCIKAVPFDKIGAHFPVETPGEETGLEEDDVVYKLLFNVISPTLYVSLKGRQMMVDSGDDTYGASLPAASLLSSHVTADQVQELLRDHDLFSRRTHTCLSLAVNPAANITLTISGDGDAAEDEVIYYRYRGENAIEPEHDATVNAIKAASLLWSTLCNTPFEMQREGKIKVDIDEAVSFLQPCTSLRDNAGATSGGLAFFGTIMGGLVGVAPLGVEMGDMLVRAPDEESFLVLREKCMDPVNGDTVSWQFMGRALIFSLHTPQSWERHDLHDKISLDEAPTFEIL